MSSDIVDSATDPVVQIQLRDPTPLQGAPQDAKIASTILYLVFQGLQVHWPPITVEHTFDSAYCDPGCGKIVYTINIEAEDPEIVLKAFLQCLNHHAPSSGIMLVSRCSRAWSYRPTFPPWEPTQ